MIQNYKYDYKKSDNGEVTVEVKVNQDYFKEERDSKIEDLGKEIDMKGFRKGKIPPEMLEQRLGKQADLEVVKKVSFDIVNEIAKDKDERVLSPLSVNNISNFEPGKEMGFSFSFQGVPDIDLKKKKDVKLEGLKKADVKDEELKIVLKEMWEEDQKATRKELTGSDKSEGTTLLGPDGKPLKKVKDTDAEKAAKFSEDKLTDTWAKKMDPSVKNLKEFKDKIKDTLLSRKKQYAEMLREVKLFDAAAEAFGIKAPKDLLEAEMINKEEEFYRTARLSGSAPAEYLKNQGISIQQMRKTWERQIKSGIIQLLVITGVAKAAGIKVENSEAEKAKTKEEKLENAKMRLLKEKVVEYLSS